MRGRIAMSMAGQLRRGLLFLLLFLSLSGAAVAQPRVPEISYRRVEPVFFENLPDNLHCLQASVMMVLHSLGHPAQWHEIDRATGFRDGLYSWTITGAATLASYVGGVRFYSQLDYKRFAQEGEAYLATQLSPEHMAVQKQRATAGFVRERQAAAPFVASNRYEMRALWPTELVGLLGNNLVIMNAKTEILYPGNQPGGHFVVLYASDGESVWLHDPGLPGRRSVKLPFDLVYSAYSGGELIVVPTGGQSFGPPPGPPHVSAPALAPAADPQPAPTVTITVQDGLTVINALTR